MFDDANLFENVPTTFQQESPQPYHDEAPVPALPGQGGQRGTQIPVGGPIATGAWATPVPGQPPPPPGTAVIPLGDSGYYESVRGIEPTDTTPEAALRSAGLTAVFVALSAGVGYAVAGWKGMVAGGLISGAVANGYRAQKNFGSNVPDQKHEAVVSGVFAAAGLGLGAFMVYKAAEAYGEEEEEEAA